MMGDYVFSFAIMSWMFYLAEFGMGYIFVYNLMRNNRVVFLSAFVMQFSENRGNL